jgi:diguanylate cyclase (GGDEF)-like protein
MKINKTLFHTLFNSNEKKQPILFWTQLTLILFLLITLILVVFVNDNSRENFYVLLLFGLMLLLFIALALNVSGQYKRSAILTVIATVIGPWGSILLDPTIFQGDFIPLVYISLSIQLCAILLSVKPTIIIAILQLCMLIFCIFLHDALKEINWPSLVSFVIATSGISIVVSFVNHKQIEKIEKQKQRLQQNEIQLREAVIRDSLTELYNRRYMMTAINKEINRAARNKHSLGIIMADIDRYKAINDTFGHTYGDYVLSLVAEILEKNTRDFDIVCRYGGDEFVLVLPDSSLSDALKRAEHLRQIIENTDFTFDGKNIKVSLSFGVAAYPEYGMSGEVLLQSADKALYVAKENGRNKVISAQSG